jgi:hypothetical protein
MHTCMYAERQTNTSFYNPLVREIPITLSEPATSPPVRNSNCIGRKLHFTKAVRIGGKSADPPIITPKVV